MSQDNIYIEPQAQPSDLERHSFNISLQTFQNTLDFNTFNHTSEDARPRYSHRRSTRRAYLPENLIKDLQTYHLQLTSFKSKLMSSRSQITEALSHSIESALTQLESVETDLLERLSFIESASSESGDFRLVQNMYRLAGLEGVLKKCPRYFMLYDSDALKLIRGLVYIGENAAVLDPEVHEYSKLVALKDERSMHLELQSSYFAKKLEETTLNVNKLTSKLKKRNEDFKKLQEELEIKDRSVKELAFKLAENESKTDFDTEGSYISKYSLKSPKESICKTSTRRKPHINLKLSQRYTFESSSEYEGLASPSSIKSFEYSRSPKHLEILEDSTFDEFSARMPWTLINPQYIHFLKKEIKSLYQEQLKFLTHSELKSQHYQKYADTRYIYYPNKGTRSINQIDAILQRTVSINLSKYIPRNFNETSTCVLPSGDVLIAGFYNPISSEAYIMRVNTWSCIKIPSLEVGRFYIKLYYYSEYVYAFGGRDERASVKTVERFSLNSFTWERMQDMKVARNCCACVGIVDKIYIFGGGARSIEVFDIETCKFRMMQLPLDNYYVITAQFDDKIFIIGKNSLRILNFSLETIESHRNLSFSLPYSIHNSLIHNGNLIYYNYYLNNLIQHNLYESQSLMKAHESPLNRKEYECIYRPRENTKILYSYNPFLKRQHEIDLSSSLIRDFSSSSSALLPNGDVFLAGFSNPVSSEAYIYRSSEGVCDKIESMNVARYFLGLAYHREFVYAIGGSNCGNMLASVERYNINSRLWEVCQDLYHARNCCGAVGVENKVFIFGGGHQAIEELNLQTMKIRLTSVYTRSFDCIGFVREDEICIIGDSSVRVFDLDLKIITEYKELWNQVTYTTNNIVVKDGNCVFYNEELNNLEKVKLQKLERKVIVLNN